MDAPIAEPRKPLRWAIRMRLDKLGLTSGLLAANAGLHWSFIAGVERAVRNVRFTKLHRIAICSEFGRATWLTSANIAASFSAT